MKSHFLKLNVNFILIILAYYYKGIWHVLSLNVPSMVPSRILKIVLYKCVLESLPNGPYVYLLSC